MSSRLKERIIESLEIAVTNFMVFAIIYKFFLHREDWLASSIIWSISWTVGRFTSQCICTFKKSRWFNLLIDVGIIVAEIIVTIFIMGVVPAWKEILMGDIVIPFGIALILYNTSNKE